MAPGTGGRETSLDFWYAVSSAARAVRLASLLLLCRNRRRPQGAEALAPSIRVARRRARNPGGLPAPTGSPLAATTRHPTPPGDPTRPLYRNNSAYEEVAITQGGLSHIRFLVHGVDVSGWLPLDRDDFTWNLHIDNPGLNGLADGIHDISTEVQGTARATFKPAPIFVHVTRGRAVSDLVPIMAGSVSPTLIDAGPHVQYVRAAERQPRAYPIEPEVEPFHEQPDESDTFGELMSPNAEWATTAQMWWEELPHNLPSSAPGAKLATTITTLRVVDLQDACRSRTAAADGWMAGRDRPFDNRGASRSPIPAARRH